MEAELDADFRKTMIEVAVLTLMVLVMVASLRLLRAQVASQTALARTTEAAAQRPSGS